MVAADRLNGNGDLAANGVENSDLGRSAGVDGRRMYVELPPLRSPCIAATQDRFCLR